MARNAYCHYCGAALDLGHEFLFEVEALDYEEHVAPMAAIRDLPHYCGEPLPICKDCRESIEENRRDLAEEAIREEARTRRLRRIWIAGGIAFVLLLIVATIFDMLSR